MDEQNSSKGFEFVNCGLATVKTEPEGEENVLPQSGNESSSSEAPLVKSDPINLKDEVTEVSLSDKSVEQPHSGDQEDDGSYSEADDWAPVGCEVQIDEVDAHLTFKTDTDVDSQPKHTNINSIVPSTSQEFVPPQFADIIGLVETRCGNAGRKYWENDTPLLAAPKSNRKNTNQGRYLCGFCPYKAADSYRLTIHLRTHSGDKPFKCKLCDYQSTQKSALTVHVKRHMGVKAYECSLCPQRYAHKRSLDMHVMKHTGGDNPIKCEECSYSTTSSYHMTLHKRTHSGEKPYACDKCPYKFAAPTNLKTHMKIHTGKFISCPHCSYKCVQERDLKRHVRRHTGDLFECLQCDYQAPTKTEVRLHMRKHDDENSERDDKKMRMRSSMNLRSTLGRTRVKKGVSLNSIVQ